MIQAVTTLHLQWPQELSINVVLVFVNIYLTIRAVYFNLFEYRYGFKEYRWINGWRAGLAAVYTCSYIFITFTNIDRVFWSQVMVGVSPLVWEIVWVRPAKQLGRIREAMIDNNITNLADRRKDAAA